MLRGEDHPGTPSEICICERRELPQGHTPVMAKSIIYRNELHAYVMQNVYNRFIIILLELRVLEINILYFENHNMMPQHRI
jgi:hypothetical protein